jgi:hypothetical protein
VLPLSEEDQAALADFRARQQVLRDLTLGCIDHTPQARSGQSGGGHVVGLAREVAIAQEIDGTHGLSQAERLRLWEQRTGLSRPTYYRRLDAGRGNTQG